MKARITIFGYGQTGEVIVDRLRARGQPLLVAQRRRPPTLPNDVEFQSCDVLRRDDVLAALRGSVQGVITTSFEYSGPTWRTSWPQAMSNFIDAAHSTGARLVQVDNLYMYGPQTSPLREDMPLTDYGVKPATRAEITRMWRRASEDRAVLWASLCAPDFYGPDVERSHLGNVAFGMIAKNKPATLILPPDMPHAFAYVPDVARGVVSLLDAPNDAFGQSWNVPCAPTLTSRQILQLGAAALGVKLKIRAVPNILLPMLGLVSPFMREVSEMRFTWTRPYHVDWRKFGARFWSDPTPFEHGAVATALAFRAALTEKAPKIPITQGANARGAPTS